MHFVYCLLFLGQQDQDVLPRYLPLPGQPRAGDAGPLIQPHPEDRVRHIQEGSHGQKRKGRSHRRRTNTEEKAKFRLSLSLGDSIDLFPCRASCFAIGRFEE